VKNKKRIQSFVFLFGLNIEFVVLLFNLFSIYIFKHKHSLIITMTMIKNNKKSSKNYQTKRNGELKRPTARRCVRRIWGKKREKETFWCIAVCFLVVEVLVIKVCR
jgi:hypothetical protein